MADFRLLQDDSNEPRISRATGCVLIVLGGIIGALLGTFVGVSVYCGPSAYNLCGLSGIFIGAPVGMVTGAFLSFVALLWWNQR